MTPDDLRTRAERLCRWLQDLRGATIPCEQWVIADDDTLQEAEATVRDLLACLTEREQQLAVANQIGDTFWEALKPLNLREIDVQNPGQHITDLIAERDILADRIRIVIQRWRDRAQMLAARDAYLTERHALDQRADELEQQIASVKGPQT